MHIHILGICGTFMGSIALLAKELGHKVTGSDQHVYPPMSTQLESQGIALYEGYDEAQFLDQPDMVVIGNAMSRGNSAVEYVLNKGLPYTSGPQWLAGNVLQSRWVLAVAGTHGKTTTSTMLAWILEQAGMAPGYLIGGVPKNFECSARLGETNFFVIEADEYDTAFFDKRSKFVHYRPRTVVLNNLEFDHADIFDDISDIQKQFHHLLRTVPQDGRVITPSNEKYLQEVLDMGCWSEQESLLVEGEKNTEASADWSVNIISEDGSEFDVLLHGKVVGRVQWQQTGMHNVSNALAALAAARHVGVVPEQGVEALNQFAGVKRRMEVLAEINGVTVYDDFAHHPTAIVSTLEGLRKKVGKGKVLAIIEPRSNTMRLGVHKQALVDSVIDADLSIWYQPQGMDWDLDEVFSNQGESEGLAQSVVMRDIDAIVNQVLSNATEYQHIVVMSNGGFGGIHQKLIQALESA